MFSKMAMRWLFTLRQPCVSGLIMKGSQVRLTPDGLHVNHNWQSATGLFLASYRLGREVKQ